MSDILIILLPTLFVGSILSAVAGTGLGIIMIIVFTIFFDVQTSVVLGTLMGLIIQPIKIFHFYKYIDWRISRLFVVLGIPCAYLGGQLLFDIPMRVLEVTIAVVCLLFVISRLTPWKFSLRNTTRNLLLCGAISGFQSGVTGLGNLIRNPLLLALGLTKERYVATTGITALLMNFARVTAYVPNLTWTPELRVILPSSILPIFFGMYVGKRMHKHISSTTFERLVLFVIFAGALKLLLFT